jgi:hypothetical protein
MGKYDLRTVTIGTLLDDPAAVEVIDGIVPGITTHPMIGFARGMTVTQALSAAGDRADPETTQRLLTALGEL